MILSILSMAVPLIIAAEGCLIAEKAGLLNIAAEGLLLAGAYTGYLVAGYTGNILIALVMAGAVSGAFGWLLGVFNTRFNADIYMGGLALNLILPALIAIHQQLTFKNKGIIVLPETPVLSAPEYLLIFLTLAISVTILSLYILRFTAWGLHWRASGINPEFVRSRGQNFRSIRRITLGISGILCGWGGLSLSLRLGAYVPQMTGGRGWIAVVALFLGRKKPVQTALACLVFAGAEHFSLQMQNYGGISPTQAGAVPYLITLGALILYQGFNLRRMKKKSAITARKI